MDTTKLPQALSDRQLDIVIGKLLGDGFMEATRASNRSKNSSLRVEQCLAQKEYVEAIQQELAPFSREMKQRTRNNPFKKKPHHASTVSSCRFNTTTHPEFTKLRSAWYPNGKKIVPMDLDLNWRRIAIWYCDDGSNLLGKKCYRRHGILCTHSFSENEVESLMSKLESMGIKCYMRLHYDKPVIYLHKDTFMDFVDAVAAYIPWNCMKHKLLKNETV